MVLPPAGVPGRIRQGDEVAAGQRLGFVRDDDPEARQPGFQGRGLLAKDIDRVQVGQRPERFDDLPRRPDVTRDQERTLKALGAFDEIVKLV